MAEPRIVCPKCGHRFPVTKALTAQIEESLEARFQAETKKKEKEARAAYEKRLTVERTKLEKQAHARAKKDADAQLSKMRASLSAAKKREKSAQAKFDQQLASEKIRLQREALKQAKASVSTKVADLRRQMKERDDKLQEMKKKAAVLQQREKKIRAQEERIKTVIAREVEAARKKTASETAEKIEKDYHNRELRHQKVVSDLKMKLGEARHKLEQSSQQTQGEVAEDELERVLSNQFPDDEIKPIGKGKAGADVIQQVYSSSGDHCGTIVWESKHTKNWNKSWLSKLRSDQRRVKAEIAVLVSSALPKNIPAGGFGQLSGVWVTDFGLVRGLAVALRANLIDVARIRSSVQGKAEKMEIIYQYLISTEFRQRVEAIVEGFVTMREDLQKEKQVTERNWAKREKQLDLVLRNVSGMVGDIQAITPAFPKIKRLELPAPG